MKPAFLILLGFSLFFPSHMAAGREEAQEYPRKLARIVRDEGGGERLQAPVARYVDAQGRIVDLVGAVHLADAAYYRNLNRAFRKYDKVLYEMIDGEGLPQKIQLARKARRGEASSEEKKRYGELAREEEKSGFVGGLLSGYYDMLSRNLRLQSQVHAIDYGRGNFAHADMSSEELRSAMAERDESWFSLFMDSLRESGFGESGFHAETPALLRHELMRALERSSEGSRMEKRAIVVSRNERCVEILDRELAATPSPRKLAIFYGALHMRDFHNRLLERGFELAQVQWLTVIRNSSLSE